MNRDIHFGDSRQVYALQCRWIGARGWNNANQDRWLQLFDHAGIIVPSDGTTPMYSVRMTANDQTFIAAHPIPFVCSSGLWWVISSTGPTLTRDVGAPYYIDCYYQ
jgi:hypothetical protein